MNEAAVSIAEQISLWYDWASFGYIPKSCLEKSCGNWGTTALASKIHLLAYRTQISSPGVALPIMGWALPQQSLNRKILNRFAYRQILWRRFLNWGFHLPNDSLLYKVDIKIANTAYVIYAEFLL